MLSEQLIRAMARDIGLLNIEIDHRHIELIRAAYGLGVAEKLRERITRMIEPAGEHHEPS